MNEFNESTCRTCGRTGCEGGPSCEMAAEMKNSAMYDGPRYSNYCYDGRCSACTGKNCDCACHEEDRDW